MGVAASLFYDSDIEKQTLYRRTTPSDDQFEEQQERWKSLTCFRDMTNISLTSYPAVWCRQASMRVATPTPPRLRWVKFRSARRQTR